MVDFLIVRNKCNKDDGTQDPATLYTHWLGEGPFDYKGVSYTNLKDFLEKKGHTVKDLSDADASPENVEKWLDHCNMNTIRAAILFDHGSSSAFFGEKNNLAEEVINKNNAKKLTEKLHVYTFACLTNADNGLGQTAVQNGCYSWLGYKQIAYVMFYEPFKECIWSYIEAMADGKTMEECEQVLRDRYLAHKDESWVFEYNLDILLLRKKQNNMTISTHYREKKPNCCIAAATAGTVLLPTVQFLRAYRNEVVLKSIFEKPFNSLLNTYYRVSPLLVKKMDDFYLSKTLFKYLIGYPLVACLNVLTRIALIIRPPRKTLQF
jgi:hypothetical protein